MWKVYEFNCRPLIFKETDQGTRVRWDECWWQIKYSSESLRGLGRECGDVTAAGRHGNFRPTWINVAARQRRGVIQVTASRGRSVTLRVRSQVGTVSCLLDRSTFLEEWKFGVYKMNGWMDLYGGDRKNAGRGY